MLLGETLGYLSLRAQLSLDITSCSEGYFSLALEKDPEMLLTANFSRSHTLCENKQNNKKMNKGHGFKNTAAYECKRPVCSCSGALTSPAVVTILDTGTFSAASSCPAQIGAGWSSQAALSSFWLGTAPQPLAGSQAESHQPDPQAPHRCYHLLSDSAIWITLLKSRALGFCHICAQPASL